MLRFLTGEWYTVIHVAPVAEAKKNRCLSNMFQIQDEIALTKRHCYRKLFAIHMVVSSRVYHSAQLQVLLVREKYFFYVRSLSRAQRVIIDISFKQFSIDNYIASEIGLIVPI